MTIRRSWTREDHIVALHLYQTLPFGSFDQRNSEIIKYSGLINRTPSALAMKLSNLASLDPMIIESGRKGLSGASKGDQLIWKEMNEDWSKFSIEIEKTISRLIQRNPTIIDDPFADGIDDISIEKDFTGEEKTVVTKARVGQRSFRSAVLSAYNNQCCMSGLSVQKLLVASHIVPWKDDPKIRLHPRNGLPLSMIHDKAFDLGIITVTNDLKILVSKKYHSKDDGFFKSSLLKFDGESLTLPNKFSPKPEFLERHRDEIFESKVA